MDEVIQAYNFFVHVGFFIFDALCKLIFDPSWFRAMVFCDDRCLGTQVCFFKCAACMASLYTVKHQFIYDMSVGDSHEVNVKVERIRNLQPVFVLHKTDSS